MAQYAVLICGSDSAHAPDATEADIAVHTRHQDELVDSGVLVTAWALTPKDMATSVQDDFVTDGPFIDSKEVVAGFYVIEAPDFDTALAVVKRNPALPMGARLEVRPVHSSYTRPAKP
jgi:hypothetical protein